MKGKAMDEYTAAALPEAKFKIFTGILKAFETEDGTPRLTGVASSTTRDHHGDNMLESALRDMEAAANNNMTIFLNHSYDVPEDVAGSVERASVVPRGYDGDGNPNWDLDMDISINRENERAVKAWRAIKNGTKLGLSIGAMIPSGGATRDKDTGALTISRLSLLETSIVSIPANPRSWISNAVKALSVAEVEAELPTITVTPQIVNTTSTSTNSVTFTMDVTESIEVDESDEPELTASDDTASQEATKSEPGTEDGIVSPTVTEGTEPVFELEPIYNKSVEAVLALLETTTAKLVAKGEELEDEKRARKQAEEQRDEAAGLANQLFTQGNAIFERLAQTPVGRKTSFTQSRTAFEDLDGIYSESFRRLLNKGD